MKTNLKKIILPLFSLFFVFYLSPVFAQTTCPGSCATSCPTGQIPYPAGDSDCGITGDVCCITDPAGSTDTNGVSWQYENPLSVNSFTQWLMNLLASIQGIVGWLAVIMIFIGGIVYILSGGSQKQATLAKDMIKWSLVGFAIAVATPALLKEIKDFVSSGQATSADLIDNANTLKKILINVLNFLFAIVGILALIGMAIGGTMYLTSAGDRERIDTGKRMILYSIIAIAVSGSGIILLKQILTLLAAK